MSELIIRTNHQPRNTLRWYELTDKERAEFIEYIDTEQKQDDAEFVRYRGVLYDLHDMESGRKGFPMPAQFKGWDNFQSDTFFSGILVKWCSNDGGWDQVIMGNYYS